jgi:hypothetical protein
MEDVEMTRNDQLKQCECEDFDAYAEKAYREYEAEAEEC